LELAPIRGNTLDLPDVWNRRLDMTALTATAERSRASRDPLLQPLRIKHLVLKNRIMSTSHASGLEVDGLPTERYQLYHEEKAKGGIALTMFGGSSNVDVDSPNIFRQLNVGTDAIVPRLQQFSERIHAYGAALMIQITHLGRRGEPYASNWLPTIAPTAVRETLCWQAGTSSANSCHL
jgi:2,4-dienoyl-CoA reductase-like NADH-dependent reductase (Old Yellow Enzyme family)